MSFASLTRFSQPLALLERSLNLGRVGHAYLFTGASLEELEGVARTVAKTLNCQNPPRRGTSGVALDCCDACSTCRRIDERKHPDVHEIRPESRLRQITIDRVRDLTRTLHLKPHEARVKVGIVVAAECLNVQASNSFLKTLEEPPDASLLLLLSTEPDKLLDTILSRCPRLAFGESNSVIASSAMLEWLKRFADAASQPRKGLLDRYRLLALVLAELAAHKKEIESRLRASSPLEKYPDLEPNLKEKFEDELTAAVEAEYRALRSDTLKASLWWLRDVWLLTLQTRDPALAQPDLAPQSRALARRLSPAQANDNLSLVEQTQSMLSLSNVQETLALEVCMLRLNL